MQGFLRGNSGAATLFMATWLGFPSPPLHTITGAHRRRRRSAARVSAVR